MKVKAAAITAFLITIPTMTWAYSSWGGPCRNEAWFGGHHWMGHGFFGGGLVMWIITLLLLGTVLFFGIKMYRNQGLGFEKPIDVLKKRLALGEISIEEFNTLKKEL